MVIVENWDQVVPLWVEPLDCGTSFFGSGSRVLPMTVTCPHLMLGYLLGE